MGLAVARDDEGKYAEAEAELRSILKIQEKVIGAEDFDVLLIFPSRCLSESREKIAEAKEFAQQAVEGARKVLGLDHPSTQKYTKLLQELKG